MVVAYLGRGRAKREKHDPDGALRDYNQALQLEPRHAEALAYRGFANFDKGDTAAALADEDAQVGLRPHSAAAYLDRCALRMRAGQLDQAEADCNKAIELNPQLASGFRYRGFLRGSKGEFADALVDYDAAVKLELMDPIGYSGRAVVKIANADLEGALTDIRRSIERAQTERHKFYAEVYLWVILAKQNRIAEANQGLTDYLQDRHSPNPEPWMNAIADFLLGKSDEAAFMAAAKRGYNEVAVRGQTSEGWYFAGVKRRVAGDQEKAADYFARSVAMHQTAYYEYILANAELKKE